MCCCAGSARYNLVAAVKSKTNVMAAILPGKFDDGDFDAWLREFDACSAANGWRVTEDKDDKILKLPAFLRGRPFCEVEQPVIFTLSQRERDGRTRMPSNLCDGLYAHKRSGKISSRSLSNDT